MKEEIYKKIIEELEEELKVGIEAAGESKEERFFLLGSAHERLNISWKLKTLKKSFEEAYNKE